MNISAGLHFGMLSGYAFGLFWVLITDSDLVLTQEDGEYQRYLEESDFLRDQCRVLAEEVAERDRELDVLR